MSDALTQMKIKLEVKLYMGGARISCNWDYSSATSTMIFLSKCTTDLLLNICYTNNIIHSALHYY